MDIFGENLMVERRFIVCRFWIENEENLMFFYTKDSITEAIQSFDGKI